MAYFVILTFYILALYAGISILLHVIPAENNNLYYFYVDFIDISETIRAITLLFDYDTLFYYIIR